MALLLSQHKMIDWLTKQISKYESLDNSNNNKEVKRSKEREQEDLDRENVHIASQGLSYDFHLST
jgi:hypothetical protein